jgi:hypothetical protein
LDIEDELEDIRKRVLKTNGNSNTPTRHETTFHHRNAHDTEDIHNRSAEEWKFSRTDLQPRDLDPKDSSFEEDFAVSKPYFSPQSTPTKSINIPEQRRSSQANSEDIVMIMKDLHEMTNPVVLTPSNFNLHNAIENLLTQLIGISDKST